MTIYGSRWRKFADCQLDDRTEVRVHTAIHDSKADLRRMLAQAAANTDPRPPLTSACITTPGPTVSDGNEQGAGADTHHQEQTP